MVFDNPDAAAQTDEHLSIFRILHPERRRQMTRLSTRLTRRSIDRRQPLREEGDFLPFLRRAEVALQLLANQANGGRLQRCAEKREHIVPAPVLGDERQILLHARRRIRGKMAQKHAKDAALAQSAANITRIEERAQRTHRVLGKSAREAHDDLRLFRRAQGADRRKEVEHVRA